MAKFERRKKARQPASPAAVETAVCNVEQQSYAERLILIAAGRVGKPVRVYGELPGGPWFEPGGEVGDPVIRRKTSGEAPRKARFGFEVGVRAQVETGRNNEVIIGLTWGLIGGLAVGLAVVLTVWIDAPADAARVTSPLDVLKLDRSASLTFGLAAGLSGALMFGFAGGLAVGSPLVGGLVGGFAGGFMVGLTGAWGAF